jgi:hypothetical protein
MYCSECNKLVVASEIKYFTPDHNNVFCDAYCSNAWYSKTFEKLDAKTDQTENNNDE